MRRAACKDWAEASCLISNLLAELEQPCRICREDSLVLTGRSPTGETGQKAATWSKAVMTVRYMCAAWYEKDRSRAAQAREDVRRR